MLAKPQVHRPRRAGARPDNGRRGSSVGQVRRQPHRRLKLASVGECAGEANQCRAGLEKARTDGPRNCSRARRKRAHCLPLTARASFISTTRPKIIAGSGLAQRFAVIVTGWRSFVVGKAKRRNRLLLVKGVVASPPYPGNHISFHMCSPG